jgi:hypothetical protein
VHDNLTWMHNTQSQNKNISMPFNIDIDPLSLAKVRSVLSAHLSLRCVFPCTDESRCFDISQGEVSARCMVEKKDAEKAKAQKDGLDDIMIRMRSFVGSQTPKDHVMKVSSFVYSIAF